jgi:hypothetical protein
MLRIKVMLRVVNAIPLEQFGANFTKGISCEKIPNDDLCRLHCANTGILINQIKHSLLSAHSLKLIHQDAEITSLRSAACLKQNKAKIPAEISNP